MKSIYDRPHKIPSNLLINAAKALSLKTGIPMPEGTTSDSKVAMRFIDKNYYKRSIQH